MPKKLTQSEVVDRFKSVHGDKYDYSLVEYVNKNTKVAIWCNVHGTFFQTPHNHRNGFGCPECGMINRKTKNRGKVGSFIERATTVHGGKYDYSRVNYKNKKTCVEIVCPEHGSFWQTPDSHINGQHGCYECSLLSRSKKTIYTVDNVIDGFKRVHGDKYDYSLVEYVGNKHPIKIVCPNHGYFYQLPNSHMNGRGCPSCSVNGPSVGELELFEYIESLGFSTTIKNDRSIISPYELDIFVPECNVAIEFNGLYWHSSAIKEDRNYHIKKTIACENFGIRLIHIYEDEWLDKNQIVRDMIANVLGKSNKTKLNARKCTVSLVDVKTAKNFCDQHHIQGYVGASIRVGLYYGNDLVAYMGFSVKGGTHDLNRYCTSHIVRGGFSKLLAYFKRHNEWTEIFTYAERRYSNGDLYKNNGFVLEHKTIPGYDYVKGINRFSRQQFMKHKLPKKLDQFDPTLTEEENMINNGYHRIYDCGVLKFTMTAPDK